MILSVALRRVGIVVKYTVSVSGAVRDEELLLPDHARLHTLGAGPARRGRRCRRRCGRERVGRRRRRRRRRYGFHRGWRYRGRRRRGQRARVGRRRRRRLGRGRRVGVVLRVLEVAHRLGHDGRVVARLARRLRAAVHAHQAAPAAGDDVRVLVSVKVGDLNVRGVLVGVSKLKHGTQSTRATALAGVRKGLGVGRVKRALVIGFKVSRANAAVVFEHATRCEHEAAVIALGKAGFQLHDEVAPASLIAQVFARLQVGARIEAALARKAAAGGRQRMQRLLGQEFRFWHRLPSADAVGPLLERLFVDVLAVFVVGILRGGFAEPALIALMVVGVVEVAREVADVGELFIAGRLASLLFPRAVPRDHDVIASPLFIEGRRAVRGAERG